MKRSLGLFLLVIFGLTCAREPEANPPDKNLHLRQLRSCRGPVETQFLVALDKNPPDALYRSLLPRQKPMVSEQMFSAFLDEFFRSPPDGDFTRYLRQSPVRPCFKQTECGRFAACVAERAATAIYVGIKEFELPTEAPPEPVVVVKPAPPKPEEPAEPELSVTRFDLTKPSNLTDLDRMPNARIPLLWFSRGNDLQLMEVRNGRLQVRSTVQLARFGARHREASPVVHVTRFGAVLVQTSRALLVLDRELTPHVVWKTANPDLRIGASLPFGDLLVLAAEGCIITLDSTFRELGRVNLGLGEGKDGHDLMLHGDEALVLDNIVTPIYLFRIDLKDPKQPRILDAILDQRAIWGHLMYQWKDEKAGFWAVLRSSSGRGGSVQTLLALDLRKPAAPVTRPATTPPPGRPPGIDEGSPSILHEFTTYSRGHDPGTGRGRKPEDRGRSPRPKLEGAEFLSGSAQAPWWVLAADAKGVHLGRFHIAKDRSTFLAERTVVEPAAPRRRTSRGAQANDDSEDVYDPDDRDPELREARMDHRGRLLVVVNWKRVQFFDVSGGIAPIEAYENPAGLPERIRLHR